MRKGLVAMYLDGRWSHHRCSARPPAGASAADALDVSRLQDGVLTPLLGIADVRTDKRIDFVGGIRGTGELERLVDGGAVGRGLLAASGVGRRPDGRSADAGGIMPPKSTWFEPKLRDGVLSTSGRDRGPARLVGCHERS